MIEQIARLEEGIAAEQLVPYFHNVLAQDAPVLEVAEALAQLADRQWHTYELLALNIRLDIERWLERTWDMTSLDYVERAIALMAYLGLERPFLQLKAELDGELTDDVREVIAQAVDELEETISDPYSGM